MAPVQVGVKAGPVAGSALPGDLLCPCVAGPGGNGKRQVSVKSLDHNNISPVNLPKINNAVELAIGPADNAGAAPSGEQPLEALDFGSFVKLKFRFCRHVFLNESKEF